MVSTCIVQVIGMTTNASATPQTRISLDGTQSTVTPVYDNCAFVNARTGVSFPAGTAITADGTYLFDTTGQQLAFNVTNLGTGGSFTLLVGQRWGADGGTAGMSSGSTSVVGTASDNSTNSTAKLPVIPARANAAAQTWTEGNQVPLSTDLAGNARVIPASTEVHLGQVGGTTTNIIVTPTITAGAYSAGNCVGGLQTLTSAMRVSGGSGAWAKLNITDHANQKAAMTVLVFKSSPAGTFTDHAAFPTMTAADNQLVAATVTIATSDWTTVGGSAYCTKVVGPMPVSATGSANLFAAVNTSGTPTYAATSDLTFNYGFFVD